jgi:hypothetical protein
MIRTDSGITQPRPVTKRGCRIPQDQQQGATSMTAIFAPQAAIRGSRALQSRDASASVAVAAASDVQSFKRICKFSLTIVLLGVVAAGIVAVKIAIWIPHFNY